MPTPEDAPTALVLEKILPKMTESAGSAGWSDSLLNKVAEECGLTKSDISQALPDGIHTLVPLYLQQAVSAVSDHYVSGIIEDMRVRDKVTSGVVVWLETLSAHFDASVKAIDWCTIRPAGPQPMTEYIWQVADAIWTGFGDTSTGFTYMSKRTTLSAVLASTLAVWRKSGGVEADWRPFLDRRIEDVMAFETFKRKFQVKLPV